ncbi:MFS general substrate transporter [Acephala macrosclerotiorum]|nr:MFS general substrate transporter [Acephala macrosclerotiorum]
MKLFRPWQLTFGFSVVLHTVQTEDINGAAHRRRQQILIVASSTMLTFTGCGLNFAFGVYQELYETLDGPFKGASAAEIDLIGTLAVSLMTMGAPFASGWTKQYSPRTVTMVGGALFLIANVAASFGTQLWHFVLTQGLLLGCATCLTYIPAVTIAPGWFNARRGLAMGIILSGTGFGGVAWAPLLRYMNEQVGFRNTLRITGILAAVVNSISALALKWEPSAITRNRQEAQGGSGMRLPRANWNIIQTQTFTAHAMGATLQATAYITPTYFFSTYARTLGYNSAAGANFIALGNACNFIGKIFLGFLAGRYGRLNALVLCTLLSSLVTLGLWLPSSSSFNKSTRRGLFLSFTCLYGFTASAYVSLFPAALSDQFGIQNFASINGLLYMIRGIGTLVGTPVAGALIHSRKMDILGTVVSFEKAIVLVGVLLMSATVFVIWARVENALQNGWKWRS